MKVDKPYTVNEKYGLKYYEVSVDSPGFNEPVNYYYARVDVTKLEKIGKARQRAVDIARYYIERDSRKWQQVQV